MIKKWFVSLVLCLLVGVVSAQGMSASSQLDQKMVEQLQGGYRYNAVVMVLVIIFIGLWLFLYRMDKRITKLEGKNN